LQLVTGATVPPHKLLRVFATGASGSAETELGAKLASITGYRPSDYVPAVSSDKGNILSTIADESVFKDQYCVGLVLLPFLRSEQFLRVEGQLEQLVAPYGLSSIHFSEIFGRKRVLGANRDGFLLEYTRILSAIPMSALSISVPRERLDAFRLTSDEERFYLLYWNNVRRAIPALAQHSVLHLLREVENNFTEDLCRREFEKILGGIEQLPELREKQISVCRHPTFFTKRCLFYSSVADLVAYASNSLQHKLDAGVSRRKIFRDHQDMIQLLRRVLQNWSGLSCRELLD
jgi:hypothetical protein